MAFCVVLFWSGLHSLVNVAGTLVVVLQFVVANDGVAVAMVARIDVYIATEDVCNSDWRTCESLLSSYQPALR